MAAAPPIATAVPTPPTPPVASAPTKALAPGIVAPIPSGPVPTIVIPAIAMPQIEILHVLHRANSIDGCTDCSGRTHLCSVGMPANYQCTTNQYCCRERHNASAHHFVPRCYTQ